MAQRGPRSLRELPAGTLEYNSIRQAFFEGWYHRGQKKTPRILRILQVRPNRVWRRRFMKYRRNVSQRRHWSKVPLKLLWHGTDCRECPLVTTQQLVPSPRNCNLCKIITTTLKRGSGGMFGPAIYLTQISSKSDGYTRVKKGRRAIILVRTIVGKAHLTTRAMNSAPQGCDSVLATSAKVKRLAYGEYAVYRRRAVIPAFVVVYR